MAEPGYQMQWYTRRSGVIRGPFSGEEISRHLLLGRICLDDEISRDRDNWSSARQCSELLPPELQNLNSWDDYQRLVIARMQVDERKGERRCQNCKNHNTCHLERRISGERRSMHNDQLVCHYLFGPPRAGKLHAGQQGSTRPLLLTLLLATLIFAWLIPAQR